MRVDLVSAVVVCCVCHAQQQEKSALATGMRMSDVLAGFVLQAVATSDPVNMLSVAGATLVTASIVIIVVFKPADSSSTPAPVPDATGSPTALEPVDVYGVAVVETKPQLVTAADAAHSTPSHDLPVVQSMLRSSAPLMGIDLAVVDASIAMDEHGRILVIRSR
jgi:hypothetical protein